MNREIERRADGNGIFPDDEAIIRVVGALTPAVNDAWAIARRGMGLEILARVTDNPEHRSTAVAA